MEKEGGGIFEKVFIIAAIILFVFALYIFLTSVFIQKDVDVNQLQENGGLLYTLESANPLSLLWNDDGSESYLNNKLVILIILLVVIILLSALLILVIFAYMKIKKISKKVPESIVQTLDEGEIKKQDFKKIEELLLNGNVQISKGNTADARKIYNEIKKEYNPSKDPNKRMYDKIYEFYKRILKYEEMYNREIK